VAGVVTSVRVEPLQLPVRCPVVSSMVSPLEGKEIVIPCPMLGAIAAQKVRRALMKDPPGVA
jgi:hypothetical protein